jgi:hypothetical protein
VAITPEENVADLEKILARAALGAAAAANAMAAYIAERTAKDTLTRNRHQPGGYHRARPGAPPAYASGKLAKSMYWKPVSRGLRASAIAGNRDKKARLLEFGGCVLQPTEKPMLFWRDSGGWWSHHRLDAEEHPFVGPTTDEAIADGELQRVAIEAFREYDP